MCLNCDKHMLLTRRCPDAQYGVRYERQTFTCLACEHRVERSIDADGNSPALVRY